MHPLPQACFEEGRMKANPRVVKVLPVINQASQLTDEPNKKYGYAMHIDKNLGKQFNVQGHNVEGPTNLRMHHFCIRISTAQKLFNLL